jgi:two-component system, NarL family, sensor kinase
VRRHSGSPTAQIRLSLANGNVKMEVKDRGKGIPQKLLELTNEDTSGSLSVGLRGMSERMRQLGGKLELSSTREGTTVLATVPCNPD